jgi:hypothetical protein
VQAIHGDTAHIGKLDCHRKSVQYTCMHGDGTMLTVYLQKKNIAYKTAGTARHHCVKLDVHTLKTKYEKCVFPKMSILGMISPHTHTHAHVHIHVCHVCTHMCVHIYVHMSEYICISVLAFDLRTLHSTLDSHSRPFFFFCLSFHI